MKKYYQCLLRKGTEEQIVWIVARGAKVGASVELLPSSEMWDVVKVFDHAISEEMLKEHQDNARRGFASTERQRHG